MHCEKPIVSPITLTGLFLFISSMPVSAGKCSLPFSNRGIFSRTSENLISHVGPHTGVDVGLFQWMISKPKHYSEQTTEGKTQTSHFRKMQTLKQQTLLGDSKITYLAPSSLNIHYSSLLFCYYSLYC